MSHRDKCMDELVSQVILDPNHAMYQMQTKQQRNHSFVCVTAAAGVFACSDNSVSKQINDDAFRIDVPALQQNVLPRQFNQTSLNMHPPVAPRSTIETKHNDIITIIADAWIDISKSLSFRLRQDKARPRGGMYPPRGYYALCGAPPRPPSQYAAPLPLELPHAHLILRSFLSTTSNQVLFKQQTLPKKGYI